MIVEDNILNEWEIYYAEQLQKEFNIKEPFNYEESDEEYIMRHLNEDKRKFKITFITNSRNNAYEEYWKIEEIK